MARLDISGIQIAITLLVFTHIKSSTEASTHTNNTFKRCIAHERSALLAFRAGLSDPANRLSSWGEGDNCCKWKGVQCSNTTGHVVKLDLQGPDYYNCVKQVLGGNISSSLVALQHLQYLDLSCNRFSMVKIPEFLGSLHELRYLDLSMSSLVGRIPPQLGNLSNLRYMNLDSIFGDTHSTDITWLSRLSSLEHLDMSWVNLRTITNWVSVVNMLPSLVSLDLSFCDLSTCPDSLSDSNLASLESLSISANRFHKHIAPNWFWYLTRLKQLDVSFNHLHGPFPYELGNMTCGPPLTKKCPETNLVPAAPEDHKDGSDNVFLFLGMSSGCVIGLWTVFCILLFKTKWRIACFTFYDTLYDWVYVQAVVGLASLTRKMDTKS